MSVDVSQFGLRTSAIDFAGFQPVSWPWALFLTMYGPVKTTFWLYVDGFFASNFAAYSCGTGIVSGITSAAATVAPFGWLSFSTSVLASGHWMPGMLGMFFVGVFGAPMIVPKYPVAYGFGTLALKTRLIAYLMSLHWTSRLTGGENLMPFLILTVIVLPSAEIFGAPSAVS